MKLGSVIAAGLGDPNNHLAWSKRTVNGPYTDVEFEPATNFGAAYFQIYRNVNLMATTYAEEGSPISPIAIPNGPTYGKTSFLILRIGHLNDPGYSQVRVARLFESDDSVRETVSWTWTPQIVGPLNDGSYTSSWSLSGITYQNTRRVSYRRTWGVLDFDIAVAGGNATITLRSGTEILASGTAAVGGSVTLTEQNSSGVSGSVTVAGGAVTTPNAELRFRWPESMRIKRDASDPPTTQIADVVFNDQDTARYVDTGASAGTVYYRLQAVSDTGDVGTEGASLSDTIPGTPEPPTGLARTSGNYNNTVIEWVDSTTGGCTYDVYLKHPDGTHIDLVTPVVASVAAAVQSASLPTITGYPGFARVVVRATNGSDQEKNLDVLDLEYDAAGAYVAPRPNAPSVVAESMAISSGLTLTIRGTYNTDGEKGTAASLQLFTRTPGGSYNYGSPDDTTALGAAVGNIKTASLSKTFVSAGFYYATMKAVTSGSVQSTDAADEVLVYVSAVDIAAPSGAISLSRG